MVFSFIFWFDLITVKKKVGLEYSLKIRRAKPMYQEFTEQQLEIRDQIRNFVKKEITHEVAIHWDEENKHP
ncbi:acyl-CoA dehydrogenase, partial [Leptospira interrogans]